MREEENKEALDYSIFENQADVAENIKESAESIGVPTGNIDKIKEGKPLEKLVAKKNCMWCYGEGTVSFAPSPQKDRTKKGKKKSGENYTRNTSKPENTKDIQWRAENMVKALCKCVRVQLE